MNDIEEKLDSLSRQVAQADVSQVRRVINSAYELGKEEMRAFLREISKDTVCLGYPDYAQVPSHAAELAKKAL